MVSAHSIRRFQNDGACSLVFQATKDSVSALIANAKAEQPINDPARVAKIHQCLQVQLSEMFFTKRLLLVEGPEDVAYLMTYLHLLDKYDDYREEGCHIVPANGKDSLLQPIAIAKCLNIPVFVVFDSDSDKKEPYHEKTNSAIQSIMGQTTPVPYCVDNIWGKDYVMWKTRIADVVKEEIGEGDWDRCRTDVSNKYGQAKGLMKNSLFIADCLNDAWDKGKKSESLERLCNDMLDWCKN